MSNELLEILIPTVATVFAAGSAVASWLAAKSAEGAAVEAKRAAVVTALEPVFGAMGSWKETADARGRIRRDIPERQDGFLTGLRPVEAASDPERLRSDIHTVSASLDRAAFAIFQLGPHAIKQFVDLFGDVFVDYWAFCFSHVRNSQSARRDNDNRLFFECLAYLSLFLLHRVGRTTETFQLYHSEGAISSHMRARLPSLSQRRGPAMFRRLIRQFPTIEPSTIGGA